MFRCTLRSNDVQILFVSLKRLENKFQLQTQTCGTFWGERDAKAQTAAWGIILQVQQLYIIHKYMYKIQKYTEDYIVACVFRSYCGVSIYKTINNYIFFYKYNGRTLVIEQKSQRGLHESSDIDILIFFQMLIVQNQTQTYSYIHI